jgi:hydrogenase expression/formation protein HypE
VPPLAGRICRALGLDPLAAIASGALLLAVAADDSAAICQALQAAGIGCAEIGEVIEGEAAVWMVTGNGRQLLPRPAQDEIARAYTLLTDWSNLQDCSSLGC